MFVAQWFASDGGENERVGVCLSQSSVREQLSEDRDQRLGHCQSPATGVALRFTEAMNSILSSRELLSHDKPALTEIDSTGAQTRTLAPAKTENGSEVHHRTQIGAHRIGRATT